MFRFPPTVDAPWAGVYLQVLIMLLAFALGVPAIVSQLMPDEVRRIADRHIRRRIWYYLAVIVGLIPLAFVWTFHPASTLPLSTTYAWIANLIVTIAIIFVIAYWCTNVGRHGREKTVHRLQRRLCETFNRKFKYEQPLLDDLVSLGEHAKAGCETDLVLDSLGCLTSHVLETSETLFSRLSRLVESAWNDTRTAYHMLRKRLTVRSPNGYTGWELESVIRGLGNVTLRGDRVGTPQNFSKAATSLIQIKLELENQKKTGGTDYTLAIETLGKLGSAAVVAGCPAVSLDCIEAIRENSNTLYHLGYSAFKAAAYHVAVAAVNQLESVAEEDPKLKLSETVSNLLGLEAHFWTGGESARRRAMAFFQRVQKDFEPSFWDCTRQAIDYHYSLAHYDTADKLRVMLKEYKG